MMGSASRPLLSSSGKDPRIAQTLIRSRQAGLHAIAGAGSAELSADLRRDLDGSH